VKNGILNKVFERPGIKILGGVANEGEKGERVLVRVDQWSSSDDPRSLALEGGNLLVEATLFTQTLVRLVEADPVKAALEEVALPDEGVIVGEVDEAGCDGLANLLPLSLLDHVDRKSTAEELLAPLRDECLGAQEEGKEEGGVGDEAEDLFSLAQTHVVAEETTCLRLSLSPHHPLDAVDLVGLVLTVS